MSVLIGHSHPKVIAAMKEQCDRLIYCYPQTANEPRARLGRLLAEIVPGDINKFFFTSGGAEANENAIKVARQVTGRHKILSRTRSYHGATNATMMLTGDPRRWASEPGAPGFIRVMDPFPYTFSWGPDPEAASRQHLAYLSELIDVEGPGTIAAFFLEAVTGTNGILIPPTSWVQGLRELTRKHGILLICDEVMSGFGRTGKWFAFEHFDIQPDIVTMAKGLTSSYVPLGAMGVSDAIAAYMDKNVFQGGSTYNAHPFAMATALAVLEVTRDEDLVLNAQRMGTLVRSYMDHLATKHPSIKASRNIGLFGMIDLRRNSRGDDLSPYNTTHPAMAKLAKYFRDEGLFTFSRWSSFTVIPPLCINDRELAEGFAIIDRALEITDAVFEG
jgi:taurine--2-oxoglutarate transaminase